MTDEQKRYRIQKIDEYKKLDSLETIRVIGHIVAFGIVAASQTYFYLKYGDYPDRVDIALGVTTIGMLVDSIARKVNMHDIVGDFQQIIDEESENKIR